LESILKHQLAAPVEFDLQTLDSGSQRLLRAAAACDGEQATIRTFADLFHHASPPLQLLRLAKEFAKAHLNHPDSPLPKEISSILYYASISVALHRLGKRITWLTEDQLRQGVENALAQPWLDDRLRALFSSVLHRLRQVQSTH
jgi:hypothetical protein